MQSCREGSTRWSSAAGGHWAAGELKAGRGMKAFPEQDSSAFQVYFICLWGAVGMGNVLMAEIQG